ncbi:MAG: hypothetical protein U0Q16_27360 [Bryobacteraceae bacterium]
MRKIDKSGKRASAGTGEKAGANDSRKFPFNRAVLLDESGQASALHAMVAEPGTGRRPLRLTFLTGKGKNQRATAAMELTWREAYAWSEWLDAVMTAQRE